MNVGECQLRALSTGQDSPSRYLCRKVRIRTQKLSLLVICVDVRLASISGQVRLSEADMKDTAEGNRMFGLKDKK